ncbi:hypothetical protein A7J15_07850 [Microbacterium sediminis]|uniref:Leucine rich repeat variant domain-containing protein n=2 Tax=Microbacterium sediminis TaxID=904291 RepID=A0A1B9NAF5_9MICO|nr:hypothetical protein A7J15_07850 [Microbacterium sediminis]
MERPELGAQIAAHPNAYGALLDWLERYGDADARSAVALRRTPPPPLPVAAAATARREPGRRRPPARRRGWAIGAVAAGAVLLLVAGAAVAWTLLRPAGSGTPTAAAERALAAVQAGDARALFGALAPSEMAGLGDVLENALQIESEGDSYERMVAALADHTEVTFADLEFAEQEIAPGVVRVTAVGGSVSIDGDPARVADALRAFAEPLDRATAASWGSDSSAIEDSMVSARAALTADLGGTLPLTLDLGPDGGDRIVPPLSMVAVDEGGWYISPVLTLADLWIRQSLVLAIGPGPDALAERDRVLGDWVPEPRASASPDAALDAALKGLGAWMMSGDSLSWAETLPLPERRLVAIYGDAVMGMLRTGNTTMGSQVSLTFDPVRAPSVDRDGAAYLRVEDLGWTWTDTYGQRTYRIQGECLEDVGWGGRVCLSDGWAGAELLALDDPAIVAVPVDGGWQVSALRTVAHAVARALPGYAEAASDGDLSELWGTK